MFTKKQKGNVTYLCLQLYFVMNIKGRIFNDRVFEIITVRIRSMTGRYCFHRCLSVNISGGGPGLGFWGGVPGLRFLGGGTWSQIFGGGTWSQIFWGGGTWSQIFGGGTWSQIFWGGYPVLVKGKIFDSRFGLIHVQTGKKKFLLRDPPAIARKLLWLHGGRYASCVHAGGLSCSDMISQIWD